MSTTKSSWIRRRESRWRKRVRRVRVQAAVPVVPVTRVPAVTVRVILSQTLLPRRGKDPTPGTRLIDEGLTQETDKERRRGREKGRRIDRDRNRDKVIDTRRDPEEKKGRKRFTGTERGRDRRRERGRGGPRIDLGTGRDPSQGIETRGGDPLAPGRETRIAGITEEDENDIHMMILTLLSIHYPYPPPRL